jgi:hypothetical protein
MLMSREEIIRQYIDVLPDNNFRFPDEPLWMSGAEIEAAQRRVEDYREDISRNLLVRLGIKPGDTKAVWQLLKDIDRIRKESEG